jgi:hypothetical protein
VSNTILYLYRVNEAGDRQLWALEVDSHKTIVSETPVESQEQGIESLGVTYKTGVDGRRTITGVDDRTRQALAFFTSEPCWFEGCEELRAKYQADLEAQQTGDGCKTCKGVLYRKYIKKVLDAM